MVLFSLAGFSCSRAPEGSSDNVPDPKIDETIQANNQQASDNKSGDKSPNIDSHRTKSIVLGGGCFWCVEAVYENVKGIKDAESGYAGGSAHDANYNKVSRGKTDHAEVIKLVYDPSEITLGQILKIFFTVAHDPTTLNRQGNDVGRQYRSAIFYANDEQKEISEKYIQQLEDEGIYKPGEIVTTLEPLDEYYPAEAYHQDYAENNPNQPYIRYQAMPKVEKLKNKFPEKLK